MLTERRGISKSDQHFGRTSPPSAVYLHPLQIRPSFSYSQSPSSRLCQLSSQHIEYFVLYRVVSRAAQARANMSLLGMLRGGRRSLPLLARLSGAAQSEAAAVACAAQAAPLQAVPRASGVRLESTYSNQTIWPETEAFVGRPAPDFTAAGACPAAPRLPHSTLLCVCVS